MEKRQKELIPYNHYKGIESIISGREPTNADHEGAPFQTSNSTDKQPPKRKNK